MPEARFLAKLSKERKLESVEPSDDIKESYLKKAESNLESAKVLQETKHYEEAVSMAYYSMYNTLTALLFRTGIKCENHSAAIMLQKRVFGLDNEQIAFAKKERVDKQYYVDFTITKENAQDLIKTAEQFNAELQDFTERITGEKIEEYRKKLSEMIKK